GELYVANGDLQMNMAQMAQNPNIKPFWPANAQGQKSTFALPYYIALVKGAPHSENGKKLIDFLLSKEAQAQVSTIAYGLPVRSDVKPTDAHYKEMHKLMDGVTVWHPDWDKVAAGLDANVARWQKATGN
ncbi:extracellular solute-binding protein, partial [Thioclava sp. BHET1]